jgi:alginate O-acetyltransferase complex protein AlgJ
MASSSSILNYATRGANPVRVYARPRIMIGARIAAALCFIIALFVPLIGSAFHWDPVESSENRILARFPAFPASWPKSMSDWKTISHFSDLSLNYYRDHFGFRNTIIRGLSLAKFKGGLALDQSTGIIMGKNGWLFFPSNGADVLADRNLDPFTPSEVDAWAHLLIQRNRFCEEHHIAFIAIIPPDKQTVYPEFLPDSITQIGPQSRLDQLIARLKEMNSGVTLIDLRPTLKEAKKYHQIYFKTDTHWNDFGGYASYPVILAAVNKALPWAHLKQQPENEFIPRSTIHSGDLARYLDLRYEYNEDWLQLLKRHPFPMIVKPENPYEAVITQGNDPHAPSLFMLHDSFTLYLRNFLGPHFSRTLWQWGTVLYDKQVLDFKPDIVIDEFLERTLYISMPQDPPDVQNAKGP